jgi:DNA-binding transcriptional LysR family regulator
MRAKRHLSDYRNQPFIELTSGVTPGYAARCQLLLAGAGFTPKVVQFADNRQTIMTLVSAGVGVSVAPALIQGSQRVEVKHIPLISKVQSELVMVSRTGAQKQALESLRAIAKSVFEVTPAS